MDIDRCGEIVNLICVFAKVGHLIFSHLD
jgi:hypothetical protein